jgi:predicted amidophosphoribosyltransferase
MLGLKKGFKMIRQCASCQGDVDQFAKVCPKCGRPDPMMSDSSKQWLAAVKILIFLAVFAFLWKIVG